MRVRFVVRVEYAEHRSSYYRCRYDLQYVVSTHPPDIRAVQPSLAISDSLLALPAKDRHTTNMSINQDTDRQMILYLHRLVIDKILIRLTFRAILYYPFRVVPVSIAAKRGVTIEYHNKHTDFLL